MKIQTLSLPGLALLLLAALTFGRQTLEKIPEVDFERETELDEEGKQQFKAFDVRCETCQGLKIDTCRNCDKRDISDCMVCNDEKRVPCYVCTGEGKLLDPLVEMACPYCKASAWYACGQCAGVGFFYENLQDGSRIERPCGACKKVGGFECSVCEGERRIDTVRVKRELPTEADLDDLRDTREELAACLEELEPFEPKGRASKTTKALEKLLARPGRTYEPLGDMLDLLEEVQKGLVKAGSGYKNFEERQNHQFLVFRDRSVHLLRHQLRVLDLCIERAEFNEKVDERD